MVNRIRYYSYAFVISSLGLMATWSSLFAAEKPLDFAHQIAPILREHCIKCHAGSKREGGLSLNTRAELLAGGENGPVAVTGKSAMSTLLKRIASNDADERMPPEGKPLTAEQISRLKSWIDAGLPWDEAFVFVAPAYEPPLRPHRVELPAAVGNRTNPIDRILDAYLADHTLPTPAAIDDVVFARRVYLDLIGLLPTSEQLNTFLSDAAADRRERLVKQLLSDDVVYAEHWLSFWNDLLRNDYSGTGFITGGRKQISRWLYESLVKNKPYDQFARELIAPPKVESAGFADGIRWRGDVSAGQTVEIQFAQSVGQSFLGINLKCASCHDSFIDRWKLDESYGLAAIYSNRPLEIHRCDKPIGRQAKAAWLFPEIGQVDPAAPQPERLKQLAALLTHPENGRFTRTIVNRFWHRLMGRGIVHPTDSMQTAPWNSDLLDYLASHLAEQRYDLKQILLLIATSQAYQSRVSSHDEPTDEASYVYSGPRTKRLTAEQFVDAVWQLTGGAPARFDAPIFRGTFDRAAAAKEKLIGQSIWAAKSSNDTTQDETFTFRKVFDLKNPLQGMAVIAGDCNYTIYLNGIYLVVGNGRPIPAPTVLNSQLRTGKNELLIVATRPARETNPPNVYFAARLQSTDGSVTRVATDDQWQSTMLRPDNRGRFVEAKSKRSPAKGSKSAETLIEPDWHTVVGTSTPAWLEPLQSQLIESLMQGSAGANRMVRASLVKSDFLMRSLGRPNRDQIVTVRPAELTTLEAIDLTNGQTLATALNRGATSLLARFRNRPDEMIDWLFLSTLCRRPTQAEQRVARDLLGDAPQSEAVEDLLWSILMLPEFQLVR